MSRNHLILPCLFLALVGLAIPACQSSKIEPLKPEPQVVTVSLPLTRPGLIDYAEYTARTAAIPSVDIRARVSGYLQSINFTSGKEVKEGDLLFVIDPRPYQAIYDKARSDVAGFTARLQRATADMLRADQLIGGKAISQEDYDRYASTKLETAAGLAGAEAAVYQAKLNLDFTQIKSPIDGRVSRNLIDVGNLVTVEPNATLLTNIVGVDPLYAYFDIDEPTLLRLMKEGRESKNQTDVKRDYSSLVVELGLADEEGFPHRGHLDFIDNRVDPATGTLQIRAKFPNPKLPDGSRALVSGLFGRVRFPVSDPYTALLVPEEALQTDQNQKILYVANEKNEVERRPVKIGALQGGMRVIQKGITAKDRVIVSGIQLVRPGMTVNPKTVKTPAVDKTPEAAK